MEHTTQASSMRTNPSLHVQSLIEVEPVPFVLELPGHTLQAVLPFLLE
jgi:hypothetical protein